MTGGLVRNFLRVSLSSRDAGEVLSFQLSLCVSFAICSSFPSFSKSLILYTPVVLELARRGLPAASLALSPLRLASTFPGSEASAIMVAWSACGTV